MAAQVATLRYSEKSYGASTAKYKVRKAVIESGTDDFLVGLIMAMRNDMC